ncbi:MAG: Gx transporter family protein [Ruminococcaceae bacterium]|nr:Gx transporter family protein [Oscillospiraceae bacterium]
MKKGARRLTVDALFAAVALTIFVIELYIPSVGIPGVKLGLANIVTVTAAFLIGPWDAGAILLCRIVLGGIFSGQVMALWYSLAGGTLCWLTMLPLRRILTKKQIWVMSVIGAVAHNVGQILVALAVTRTAAILYYLPVLMVSGVLAGLFTGIAAQLAVNRLDGKIGRK